jgi:hypothetical protein
LTAAEQASFVRRCDQLLVCLTGNERFAFEERVRKRKTTLLRWLAVSAARDILGAGAAPARWGDHLVPLLLSLRQFARGDFPSPEELPAATAKIGPGELPDGWPPSCSAAGGRCCW